MKTATKDTPATVAPDSVAAAASAILAQGKGEAVAFADKVKAIQDEGANVRPIALEALAENFGRSANRLGRPSAPAWFALMLALSSHSLPVDRRLQLARIANKAQADTLGATDGKLKDGTPVKPVASCKGKASSTGDKAQLSASFNTPASLVLAAGI